MYCQRTLEHVGLFLRLSYGATFMMGTKNSSQHDSEPYHVSERCPAPTTIYLDFKGQVFVHVKNVLTPLCKYRGSDGSMLPSLMLCPLCLTPYGIMMATLSYTQA